MENGNEGIYPGALVTCSQSILMLVAFLLKHKLTDAALTDLLDILNLFLPNTFPRSKYKFYKTIQVKDSQVRSNAGLAAIKLELAKLKFFPAIKMLRIEGNNIYSDILLYFL